MEAHPSKPPLPFPDLTAEVFRVDLILETIVGYVIHDKGKIHIPKICTVRQVNRDWLRATTKAMVKSKKAVFRIETTPENSTSYIQENRKILNQLRESVTLGQVIKVPLYSLSVDQRLLEQKNFELLLDCLADCGNNLIELDTKFPVDHLLQPLLPNTSLSNLTSFFVDIMRNRYVDNALSYIQSVFSATTQLRLFKLAWSLPNPSYLSQSWSFFSLPTSLTEISLFCPLSGDHMEILVQNHLPNLKTLILQGTANSQTGVLIYNIMENCRGSLQKFCLFANEDDFLAQSRPSPKFKFPLMHKLESFLLATEGVELEEGSSSLEQLLPSLKHLILTKQTPVEFRNWAGTSHFESVSSLVLTWHFDWLLLPGISALAMLSGAFPNLVKLDVTFHHLEHLDNLKLVWRRLKSLRDLAICVPDCAMYPVRHPFDAPLTGLPQDRLEALKENPSLQDDLQLHEYPDSIRNLPDLEKLYLECLSKYSNTMISDASFQFAFFKLPKLSTLTLVGRFKASVEMTRAWEADGRSIENLG